MGLRKADECEASLKQGIVVKYDGKDGSFDVYVITSKVRSGKREISVEIDGYKQRVDFNIGG